MTIIMMFRSTRQQRDHTTAGAIISEYSLVGEVTLGAAAVFDDPSYAEVSNNQYLSPRECYIL